MTSPIHAYLPEELIPPANPFCHPLPAGRKLLSIALSYLFFAKPFTAKHGFGAALFALSIAWGMHSKAHGGGGGGQAAGGRAGASPGRRRRAGDKDALPL